MDLQLAGKRALVTGSSDGIGEGIAMLLAMEGARVVVQGRNADKTNAVADRIRAALGNAENVASTVGDLAHDDEAAKVADVALAAFGGSLDILVNVSSG